MRKRDGKKDGMGQMLHLFYIFVVFCHVTKKCLDVSEMGGGPTKQSTCEAEKQEERHEKT